MQHPVTHPHPPVTIPQFLPPQQLLHSLLSVSTQPCQCTQQQQSTPTPTPNQPQQTQQLQSAILYLQQDIDAMNHEVVEVENLLGQRDVLYHQLEHLRAEREGIEDELADGQDAREGRQGVVRGGRGLREMNQRLRRRIREVREYVDKMEAENVKIEQAMPTSQSPPKGHYNFYTEYRTPASPAWMDRTSIRSGSKERINRQYFDGLKRRLQVKQEQAWERVKRQEYEIQQRNAKSLMNFNRNATRTGYVSPKYRAEYRAY